MSRPDDRGVLVESRTGAILQASAQGAQHCRRSCARLDPRPRAGLPSSPSADLARPIVSTTGTGALVSSLRRQGVCRSDLASEITIQFRSAWCGPRSSTATPRQLTERVHARRAQASSNRSSSLPRTDAASFARVMLGTRSISAGRFAGARRKIHHARAAGTPLESERTLRARVTQGAPSASVDDNSTRFAGSSGCALSPIDSAPPCAAGIGTLASASSLAAATSRIISGLVSRPGARQPHGGRTNFDQVECPHISWQGAGMTGKHRRSLTSAAAPLPPARLMRAQ